MAAFIRHPGNLGGVVSIWERFPAQLLKSQHTVGDPSIVYNVGAEIKHNQWVIHQIIKDV